MCLLIILAVNAHCSYDRSEMCAVYYKLQGDCDIDTRNNRRQTPLLLAVSQVHAGIVEVRYKKKILFFLGFYIVLFVESVTHSCSMVSWQSMIIAVIALIRFPSALKLPQALAGELMLQNHLWTV